MNKKYSEEFKLSVVNEYYEGNLGVRKLAEKYKLPSKNYITEWIKQFKENGIISQEATPSIGRKKDIKPKREKTPYEKELEKKLERAEAELAFYKKCDELLNRSKKK